MKRFGFHKILRFSFQVAAICVVVSSHSAWAQRGLGDWMTAGGDAQRSFWLRNDAKISSEKMLKPGFELVWKLAKLNETPRRLNSLTTPVLLDFYIGYKGFRSLGFLSGSSGNLIAIDTDLARMEWHKTLPSAGAQSESIACPGGTTSNLARPMTITYPPLPTGRGLGRGSPAKSAVGEPHAGAVTLKPRTAAPPPPPKPAPTKATTRVSSPPNPFAPRAQFVYALSSNGGLHALYVSNGEEPNGPTEFLPPNANAQGLMLFEGNAYVTTVNGCGGVADGVWSLNLESKKVNRWEGAVAGTAGTAVRPEGVLYVAGGNSLTALEEGTLKTKGSYSIGSQKFTTSPVIFEFKGKDMIAAASNDGRIHVLDTAQIGGQATAAKSQQFSAADYAAGALASWQDLEGTRWILAPSGGSAPQGFPATNGAVKNGSIVAWKVVEKEGGVDLVPGWVSRDMTSPLTPIIVNGVVFAVSSGEYRSNDPKLSLEERVKRSSRAVLYALDGETGKELWNSGNIITSFVHSGGLSAGGAKVYIGAYDGTQYAFGYPIEH